MNTVMVKKNGISYPQKLPKSNSARAEKSIKKELYLFKNNILAIFVTKMLDHNIWTKTPFVILFGSSVVSVGKKYRFS